MIYFTNQRMYYYRNSIHFKPHKSYGHREFFIFGFPKSKNTSKCFKLFASVNDSREGICNISINIAGK